MIRQVCPGSKLWLIPLGMSSIGIHPPRRKGEPIKLKLIKLFGVSSQAFALAQSTEVSSRNPDDREGITLVSVHPETTESQPMALSNPDIS